MSASKIEFIRKDWRRAKLIDKLATEDTQFAADYRRDLRAEKRKADWIIEQAIHRQHQARRAA